nr:efflux RND transporter periplasmic adaptor subunit [uncultured Desulfobulbus sp.]
MQKIQIFFLSWKGTGSGVLLSLFLFFGCVCTSAAAETNSYEGIIEPSEVVEVGSPVGGIVAQVLVDRGSTLTKGQALVKLESSMERAALEEVQARAGFEGAIEEQRAQLGFAQRSHQRIRPLGAIPVLEKDRAATQAALARHRLKKALEARTLAELEQKKAEADLARRVITSPLDGLVMARFVSPGEYVGNQPLLRIATMDPLRVEVIVPAALFGQLHVGEKALITPELPTYGQQEGTILLVDQFIDAASNTFGVRLKLPNPEHQIPSGLKCQVRFLGKDSSDAKETSVLPTSTLSP